MHLLQGFRTIIFNTAALITAWLANTYGFELSEIHQTELTTTLLAIANIGLRLLTKTPVGKKEAEEEEKGEK